MSDLRGSTYRNGASLDKEERNKEVKAYYLYEDQIEELKKTGCPSRTLRDILQVAFEGDMYGN